MNFSDLQIYQNSYELALKIHRMTQELPREAQLELGSQIKRSSKSIPANIAEGFAKKNSQKDFCRFLFIALGSSNETLVHLNFLKDLNYLDVSTFKKLYEEYETLCKMINRFIQTTQSNF